MLRERIKQALPPRYVLHAKSLKEYWKGAQELRLLSTWVDRTRGSLDIGAAEGIYTYFLARLCKHVDAYEPNPVFHGFFSASAARNVTLHKIALSDRDGESTLSIPIIGEKEIPWRATLCDVKSGIQRKEVVVPTRRLDEMEHSDVGFIKIDVEGHETAVLRGGKTLIERCAPTLLVEIEQRFSKIDIHDVFAEITDMGYSGFFLLQGSLQTLDRFDVNQHQLAQVSNPDSPNYINNFIFVPKSRVATRRMRGFVAENCQHSWR